MEELTAPGATGPGTVARKHVVEGIRTEQGQLLNLPSMEGVNAKDQALPHKVATPKSAQVNRY